MRIGVARLLVVAGIAALAFSTSYSQTGAGPTGVTANADNATPMPGAGHDYIHLLGETVSPANGSVNVKIDFGAPRSRGITLPDDFVYDTGSVFNLTQDSITHEIEFEIPYVVGQGDLFPVATWTESSYQPPPTIPGTGLSPIIQPVCNLATGFTFRGPDGVRHNLPLAAETTATQVSGGPTGNGNCGGSPGITVGGSGSIISSTATDGVVTGAFTSTAATLTAVGAWQVNVTNPTIIGNVGAFTITDSGGTTYFFSGGAGAYTTQGFQEYAYQVEDRNGNIIPWCGLTYCDTAGRPMDASTSSGFTVGGVNYTNSNGTAGYAKISYTVPETQVLPLPENNPEDIGCNGEPLDWNVPPAHSSMGTPEVPREQDIGIPGANGIELYYHLYFGDYNPNDSTVENPYGLINEIIYPDGGWVKYTWNLAAAPNYTQAANFAGTYLAPSLLVGQPAPNGCVYEYATPAVAERQVSYDGTTVAQTQKFSYSTVWGTGDNAGVWTQKKTTVATTDNITGKTMQTVYTYVPGSLANAPGFWGATANYFPVEQTIARYDWGNTTTPLDTEIKGWFTNTTQVSQLACDFHISNDGKSTGHFYQYQYSQISDDKEYDYGQIASPASVCTGNDPTAPSSIVPIRESVTNFQTFVNPQGIVFAKPSSVIIYSSGSPIAETDYSYDQFSLGAPIVATNHDETSYSPSARGNRGNATSITHQCVGCTNATTTYTYDETGQLSSMTDPCGNATCSDISGANHTTTYSFTDSPAKANAAGNSNAYLTQVTRPNTGVAHTESYQYNYVSGQVTQATDENSNSTGYKYNDPLLRLTETDYPDGGSTIISYVDSAPSPSVTTTTLITSITTLKKASIMDGMGHVVQTQLLSDPSGQVNVDTVYNGVGGVYSVSNPYGPSGTPVLTTNTYDALGHKVTQKQTDGSTLQWCYNGVTSNSQTNCLANASSKKSNVWIDFSDENGNHWQRSYDGLGRLGSVMEPNASQVPSIETDYTYNGLDDLVGATQNGVSGETPRTRSFTYNSLGQLTSASNPEAGTICYGTWSGSKCLGNGYDANGNVAMKSDARNVVTNYKYDALNRVLSKTYSNDPSNSPFSCYQYDTYGTSSVPNATGLLTAEWTQSASAGACSTSASSIWTKRLITKYDTMGRVQNEQQFTPATLASGTPYSPAYLYDLAGNLISSTDGITPSHTTSGVALTFSNCFDGASRLQTVSSNWIDTTHPQSLFSAQGANSVPCPNTSSPTVSATTYAPFGGLMNAILGNRLTVKRNYDVRLRLTSETDTGTGAAAATLGSTAVTVMGSEQVK